MTTFQAVSAHWPKKPKPPRSTQKSRRSKASSPPAPNSGNSTRLDHDDTKPSSADRESGDASDNDDLSEEENPFDLFATQAASQAIPDFAVDVNPNLISRTQQPDNDPDEEDMDQDMRAHERDAKQHAEEGVKFRATQAPASDAIDGFSDDFDDAELDELFRRTVAGGWSNQTTPKKQQGGLMTPTTGSRTGRSALDSKLRRDQVLREQAGLGDLR